MRLYKRGDRVLLPSGKEEHRKGTVQQDNS